ncbi:dTMP kinase [Nocardiopsis changdeensis]|uniref:Thymidylate kinase n=1 Tax=Nocardiopsis changdeensis TaxID=2831969 RepID=A0ABX8BUU1_9ACTN|nr:MULTISPECIES: AAA family ATPase [Nocardiopsis]QUX24143.1 AAA family ATPase [Nocardiopsis changdeensis]QYX34538.1 AAA family ATPase [Nocardiopsis sp. MT53]
MATEPRPGTIPAGRLITVTGIDGAGKSTLATALVQRLNAAGEKTVLVGKHTTGVPVDPALSAYVDGLNALVYRRDAEVAQQCGDHYWLLALAAWYTLQDRLIVRPALESGTHVVLDNAHHKILARYAVNPGVPTDLAEQVFAHLTIPDLVLFLRIDAAEALRRKGGFTSLEAGHSGAAGADFVRYQDTVTDQLSHRTDPGGWVWIDVAGKDRGQVLDDAAEILWNRFALSTI